MKKFRHGWMVRALLIVALSVGGFAAEKKKTRATNDAPPAAKRATQKVDVNTADAKTLEALPGVGPEIAREIIAARPFKSIDDLERVRGIGPERLEVLRNEVTVTPPVAATKRRLGEPTLPPAGRDKASAPRGDAVASHAPVNINTASQQELEVLPGIGPVKAAAIIEARMERPFASKADIMRVKGIKEETFNQIKDQITVR